MRVLLIEDDINKTKQLVEFLNGLPEVEKLDVQRSYQSGLKAAILGSADLIVLDMTLPRYDVSPTEKGGRTRAYAGRELLGQLVRKKVLSRVVVVTQFDNFKEGRDAMSLDQLAAELARRFPGIYLGTIFYQSGQSGWREELMRIVHHAASLRRRTQ